MADLTIVFVKTKTRIDSLELDASLVESHDAENDVTEHPVEAGYVISDHVRRKPLKVTIEGIVSNAPVVSANVRFDEGVSVAQQGQFLTVTGVGADDLDLGRAETAYATLMDLFNNARVISLYTRLKQYDNMVIESLRFPRDCRVGDALRFTACCREIRVVQSQTVQVSQPRGAGKQHSGKKTGEQAAAPVEKKASLLFQAKQYVSSKWSSTP